MGPVNSWLYLVQRQKKHIKCNFNFVDLIGFPFLSTKFSINGALSFVLFLQNSLHFYNLLNTIWYLLNFPFYNNLQRKLSIYDVTQIHWIHVYCLYYLSETLFWISFSKTIITFKLCFYHFCPSRGGQMGHSIALQYIHMVVNNTTWDEVIRSCLTGTCLCL